MNAKALSALFGRAALLMVASLVVLLWSPAPLLAQVDTGTILGTVTDASGASASGATVTLTNEGTNASLSTTTGPCATYHITPLRVGSYKLSPTLQRFQTNAPKNRVVN